MLTTNLEELINVFYISIMNISPNVSAMKASFDKMAVSAHNVANINTPGFETDLAREVVEQIKSEKELAANASVVRTQDKMLGETVNLLA